MFPSFFHMADSMLTTSLIFSVVFFVAALVSAFVGLAIRVYMAEGVRLEHARDMIGGVTGLVVTLVALVLGLLIALMLNRRFAGRWLVQSIVLLPLMVAPVIAAIMIRWMFNDQFGVVNAALEGLGIAPIAWLTQRWTAFLVILITDVWLWTPWFALILLAGLQSLPPEPFEAAQIDAASRWRTFRHITLPMLRPVMVVCVVIRAIDAFRTFDIVWTISGGGPARATEVFSIYAYVESFQFLNLARGSAAAVIGAVIIVIFALALYRLLNRFVEVSR